MAWIICGAIIGFILLWSDFEFFVEGCLGAVMGALVGFIIYTVIGGAIGSSLPLNKVVEEQEIYALTDNSSIEGASYLFSGYINENLVCRYVISTDRGKHIEQIDADYVYINEGDYKPIVKHYTYVFEKEWYKWFAHTAFVDDYYEFYVPENTVTNEYNIDLN